MCSRIFFSVFKNDPQIPPSRAQIARNTLKTQGNEIENFFKILKIKSFLLVLLVYGIHIGAFNAMATLLNRVFGSYFPVRIIFQISYFFRDWPDIFKNWGGF